MACTLRSCLLLATIWSSFSFANAGLLQNFQDFAFLNPVEPWEFPTDDAFPSDSSFPSDIGFPPVSPQDNASSTDMAFPPVGGIPPDSNFPPNNAVPSGTASFPIVGPPSASQTGTGGDSKTETGSGVLISPVEPPTENTGTQLGGANIDSGMPIGQNDVLVDPNLKVPRSSDQNTDRLNPTKNQSQITNNPGNTPVIGVTGNEPNAQGRGESTKIDWFLPQMPSGESFVNLQDGTANTFFPTENWLGRGAAVGSLGQVDQPPQEPPVNEIAAGGGEVVGPIDIGPVGQPSTDSTTTPTTNTFRDGSAIGFADLVPFGGGMGLGPIDLTPVDLRPVDPLVPVSETPTTTTTTTTESTTPSSTTIQTTTPLRTTTPLTTTVQSTTPKRGVVASIASWLGFSGRSVQGQGQPRGPVIQKSNSEAARTAANIEAELSPTCRILGMASLTSLGRDKQRYRLLRRECAEERRRARQRIREQQRQTSIDSQRGQALGNRQGNTDTMSPTVARMVLPPQNRRLSVSRGRGSGPRG
ncbi:mucin-2-like isoform X1 [Mya arenaria]|uniref:mucin-2-like isoform X1 n=1 Tax=Mya arenaria TaxID=6604 RepID=UPI0022E501E6|nr:mucin-2-like isoform X1 [Mya arenaria]